MSIVFIGSNPSNASSGNSPFMHGTRSRATLEKWIEEAGIEYHTYINGVPYTNVFMYNVAPTKTPENRPLTGYEITQYADKLKTTLAGFKKIVALGKTAHKALELAGIPHLELGHPSGLNRKLNDKKYVKELIRKLREYAK